MSRIRARSGATLLELMVALAILAIAAGVVVPALRHAAQAPPTLHDHVAAARREALEQGRAVTRTLRDSAGTRLLTAYPDGRVAADTVLGVDPLTGRPRAR
ncbi:MAG TPA: prepilin-type N-terminal cleavage/methylation domain-containing protein [Longimicrobium sp.]|nr:prepilin-type N-terminal cleavage/methylation domain-containing protein [Longimicrobium sp.]